MPTQIILRHGLERDWIKANPTLAKGELGIETDTKRFKVGDGFSTYVTLDYFINSGGAPTINWGTIEGLISEQTDLQAILNAKQPSLESGINIKSINGESILGSGNLVIESVAEETDPLSLHLDQTTPQTITGGTPSLDREISDITEPKHLITKEFLEAGIRSGGRFTKQTLTDTPLISWDVANGNYATEIIEGSRIQSNPSNFTVGQELIIDITQGAGGGHTITWDTYFTFGGDIEPILSSVEGDTDSLRFLVVSATEIRFTNANFDV